MRIAITTPTGNIGRELVRILQSEGDHELVLLARDAAKLAAEAERGARVFEGSLSDPVYVTEATKEADVLFFLIPPGYGEPHYRKFQAGITDAGAQAVKANGIPHVVLLSSVGAQHAEGTGPIAGLHHAEVAFAEAGTTLTALRPTYFMENYFANLESILSEGHVYLPLGGATPMNMIATRDIARVAADAVIETPEDNRVLELLGPREYTFAEAAQLIGEGIGKPVQHIEVTPEQTREALVASGIGEDLAGLYLEMFAAFESGHVAPVSPRSDASTTPTHLETFAKEAMGPMLQPPA